MISEKALIVIDNLIQKEEGGWKYTDHPADIDIGTYGGMRYKTFKYFVDTQTIEEVLYFKGITAQEFKTFALGHGADIDSVNLKRAIRMAYCILYYEHMHVDLLDDWKYMVFSCAVNVGVHKATEILQESINSRLKIDGIFGSKTIEAIKMANLHYNNQYHFVDLWMKHYFNICKFNPAQMIFINGWYNRAVKYR